MAAYVVKEYRTSISKACRIVNLPKSMYYYHPIRDDSLVISKLQELALKYPREGQDLYYKRIRQEGIRWNYKRIRRVYLLLGMKHRRKVKKRVPARVKVPLQVPQGPCQVWSMDFMHDVLMNKRKFRTLNIIDDYNRQAIAVEADHSLSSMSVIHLLERIIQEHGKPLQFRVDNGPEWTSLAFRSWCQANDILIQYIQPGKPMQNGYIERFNRTYRQDILDAHLFDDIMQVKILTEEWMEDYNHKRPHQSLGDRTPMAYKQQMMAG